MTNFEIVSFVTNLGALSVAGVLYVAYIKSLNSQIDLKNCQINIAEQNVKLWKDKALNLERQTPQFIEKILAERIKIREEEIDRLIKEEDVHQAKIDQKNIEVEQLKKKLEHAHNVSNISVFDSKTCEFKQIAKEELDLKKLGDIWIDSASLMICDPMHVTWSPKIELENYPVTNFKYKDPESSEIFYVESEDETIDSGDSEFPLTTYKELEKRGRLIRLPTSKNLPAEPETYINGGKMSVLRDEIKCGTFINGCTGAGIAIGLGSDGYYKIHGEFYNGTLQRIYIDL